MTDSSTRRFGFLGTGIIAEVFMRRLLDAGVATPDRILGFDTNAATLERVRGSLGIVPCDGNAAVAAASDVLFLAVPPPATVPVIRQVASALRPGQVLISLAAAVTTEWIEAAIGSSVPVVRVIPNTPSLIGHGVNPFCVGRHVDPATAEAMRSLLGVFGIAVELPEALMDAATALTAVGPTYVFPVIAALAEAAAAHGLPAVLALQASAQMVSGAARLAAETGRHPDDLKQMISTRTLDEAEARRLFVAAVDAAHDKVAGTASKIAAALAG